MTDLILRAKSGDQEAQDELLNGHKNMVKKIARTFFIMGADFEDIVQEGMIGLFNAIRTYEAGRNAGFETYAKLCITRQILNALKVASRKKHAPLNFYVPLEADGSGELNLTSEDTPESLLILKEDGQSIMSAMRNVLSELELTVLNLYLEGLSHTEIAQKLGKNEKSVDNAIGRTRNKVRKLFSDRRGL